MKERRRASLQRPTVADVAREAGVSPMTVSRVVNGHANVNSATRDKVNDAIAKIGYVPNQAARNLAAARQSRIALLYSNPSSAFLSEFLVGCLAEAASSEAELIIEYASEDESTDGLTRRLLGRRVDAALLPPPLCDQADLVGVLDGAGILVAQIATARSLDCAFSVSIDDEAAAYAITAHLLERGHRRIGFIAGNPNQTASALREAGYKRAISEAGIEPRPELEAEGDFTYRSGLRAAEELLRLEEQPTAIFASNDDMAAAAAAVAHRKGVSVPGDLSICGYDDTPIATTVWPELTTVRQPIQDMARRATRLLIEAVRHSRRGFEVEKTHVLLGFDLVIRDSG